ncbi:MAG: sugar kinase [Clostridia bacterium]|nr:sugar kinase [Clostridia bacterium]
MTIHELNEILIGINSVKVGVVGDFCVDIYWKADMTKSELSKETPHFPLPVTSEVFSPGAAGNVAANMAALRPALIRCVGVRGDDWRGTLLDRALRSKGVNAELITVPGRFTNAYCKPLRAGISNVVYEDPRIDFESFDPIDARTEDRLLTAIDELVSDVDIIAVCDQFRCGAITPRVREKLNGMTLNGTKIIVDSRYHIEKFRGMFLKPNEFECADALGQPPENYELNAKLLASDTHGTVIETLGAKGSLITNGQYLKYIPAVQVNGEIDICGAGDTSLAALTLSLGAGFNLIKCAELAAAASAVTIQKIGETGTASPEELMRMV